MNKDSCNELGQLDEKNELVIMEISSDVGDFVSQEQGDPHLTKLYQAESTRARNEIR